MEYAVKMGSANAARVTKELTVHTKPKQTSGLAQALTRFVLKEVTGSITFMTLRILYLTTTQNGNC